MNSIFFEKVLKLDEFSKSDLTDLSQKRFLIIGAGGIAHPLIMNLLGHGVKHLSIADGDKVETDNLHRQFLFDFEDIGLNKAFTVKKKLINKFPNLKLEIFDRFLDERDLYNNLNSFDIVVDCSDNFATKYNSNEICHEFKKPLFIGSANGYIGQAIFIPNTVSGPCYECLFPRSSYLPEETCNESGIAPYVLSYVASILTMLITNFVISGLSAPIKLYRIDAKKMELSSSTLRSDTSCIICGADD